ncbi:DUF4199 domain-containing protein [Spirosoma rigui]|uniref:DUF4199 domain-containing protein n=1 Tax=Spirosoma rigui TaxID=564064 RepID=UPI0009B0D886|nr:DUF4199 domain-containing protein [Spirosoma rigui]
MNDETSTARVALKWGVITGLALIVYSTLLYTLGQMANGMLTVIIYVIIIIGLVLGMREYRTLNGGYLTFGEGVGLGALLSAVAGLLSSAYTVLYSTVIDPGMQERVTEQMRDQLETQGMSDEQIEQAVSIAQTFQSPGLQFIIGIFGTIFIGVVFSLVIAAILRQSKANPFE